MIVVAGVYHAQNTSVPLGSGAKRRRSLSTDWISLGDIWFSNRPLDPNALYAAVAEHVERRG